MDEEGSTCTADSSAVSHLHVVTCRGAGVDLPRAALVKASAREVLDDLGARDELLDLAQELEAVALSDDFFLSRRLYPNVDFYSGLIYQAMGFPPNMLTVLFALGRLPGWIAHWREMITDPATKIGRPRQVYTGPTARDYVQMDHR